MNDRVDSLQRMVYSLKDSTSSLKALVEVYSSTMPTQLVYNTPTSQSQTVTSPSSPTSTPRVLSNTLTLGGPITPDTSQMSLLLAKLKSYVAELQTEQAGVHFIFHLILHSITLILLIFCIYSSSFHAISFTHFPFLPQTHKKI